MTIVSVLLVKILLVIVNKAAKLVVYIAIVIIHVQLTDKDTILLQGEAYKVFNLY